MAKVLCAMSGGVDSSVAAYLLKRAGHEVLGVFLRLGPDAARHAGHSGRACCSIEDSRDAALVASRLDIPYYSMNYEGEFGRIIDHFVGEYNRGKTPIPCVLCNQWLKFGSLRAKAHALGCDWVATGHYARIEPDTSATATAGISASPRSSGAGRAGVPRRRLLRGRDRRKDQSYFLFLMPPESLRDTLFPAGEYTKAEIRELAREANLPVAEKPESQEICFVPNDDYREVLRARTPEKLKAGRFVDLSGKILGTHGGFQNFTIGQRRGTGIALGEPHYVVDLDPDTNVVTLGPRDSLAKDAALIREVQWLSIDPPPPGSELRVEAQVRHRHKPVEATVRISGGAGDAIVHFDKPQDAVTPGQAAVFYDGDIVLGGGWIESAAE